MRLKEQAVDIFAQIRVEHEDAMLGLDMQVFFINGRECGRLKRYWKSYPGSEEAMREVAASPKLAALAYDDIAISQARKDVRAEIRNLRQTQRSKRLHESLSDAQAKELSEMKVRLVLP